MAEYRTLHDRTAAAMARSMVVDELTPVLSASRVDDSRLMRTSMDSVEFDRSIAGTSVTMRRRVER